MEPPRLLTARGIFVTWILCYHSVDPDWDSVLSVPAPTFAAQASWLAEHRTLLPIDRAATQVDRAGRLPPGTAALTFDDGYADVHEHAAPVVARLGIPAAMFVVAGTLTSSLRPADWLDEKDLGSGPPDVMGVDELRELASDGWIIGSHGNTHRDLTALSDDEAERDLEESRETLEDLLGRSVSLLAYPRGRCNERVKAAALRAGFSHALSLPESKEPADAFAVPRVGVYRGDGVGVLRAKLSRWYLPVRTGPLFPVAGKLRRAAASLSRGPSS